MYWIILLLAHCYSMLVMDSRGCECKFLVLLAITHSMLQSVSMILRYQTFRYISSAFYSKLARVKYFLLF